MNGPKQAALAPRQRLSHRPEEAGRQPADRLDEMRATRAELEHQIRLNALLLDSVEQFASLLVHDVKNPLAAIKVNAQSLKRWLDRGVPVQPEQWRERLGRMEIAVDQVLEVIARARAQIAADGQAELALDLTSVDPAALLRDLVGTYQSLTRQHRFVLDCPSANPVGQWDGSRLRLALRHVLDNSLKFSPQGGQIDVKLRRETAHEPNWVVIEVRDRGIGIPPRDLPFIFDRFYRGDNVVGRFKGAGLGLSETRQIIVSHGGQVHAECPSDGGSRLLLRLPLP